jgi:hypothetical protein
MVPLGCQPLGFLESPLNLGPAGTPKREGQQQQRKHGQIVLRTPDSCSATVGPPV